MKNQEVVVGVKFHDFENEEGQWIQGGKIYILGKRELTSNEFGGFVGYKVAESKISLELAKKMYEQGPGTYDIEYDVNINRDNVLTLVPLGATFLKEFKF